MDKVEQLEKELYELRLKMTSLEVELQNAERQFKEISADSRTETYTYAKPAYSVPGRPLPNGAVTQTTQVQGMPNNAVPQTAQMEQSYTQHNRPVMPQTVNQNPAYGNNNNTAYSYNAQQQNVQQRNMQRSTSTESWIGKILMGALASLLIFIALITFAKLLLPYLTDTIKIALMFVGSTALTVTGFALSKKKPSNTFYKALLACGSACIYLSILVTGIHFKAINSIVMYVLLALWAMFMIFLKENKNDRLFFAIGNLGYFVSIMFTVGLEDEALLIPMLVYVVAVAAVYQIIYFKSRDLRNTQCIVNVISLLIYQIIVTVNFDDIVEVYIISALTIIWAFAGMLLYVVADLFEYNKNNFIIAVVNIAAYIVSYVFLDTLLKFSAVISFGAVILPAIVIEVINAYWRSNKQAKDMSVFNAIVSGILFFISAMILCYDNNFIFTSGIILIVYACIVAYGFVVKDSLFKTQGWVLIAICMVIATDSKSSLSFYVVAAVIAALSLLAERLVYNDSAVYKLLSYICLLVSITRIGILIEMKLPYFENKFEVVGIITYAVEAALNMIFILTGFYKTNDKNNGKNCRVGLDIINLILIISGVIQMGIVDSNLIKSLYMVLVFALAGINIPLKENGTNYRYLYTGVKFGALLLYSLSTFKTPSFVISVCMIAFAVLCIALGFKNSLLTKELRVFGLITTLIFVVKFIVFDISFDSSVLKALSYLLSGILCFGISAIYNHFEKRTAAVQNISKNGNSFANDQR